MLEFEKKLFLSKEEYTKLLQQKNEGSVTIVQKNHYYDSDTFEMNRLGITCRIREKNGKYKATIKAHQSKESECSIETSKAVLNENDDSLFKNLNIKYQGSLITHRTILYSKNGIKVVLDENTYLDFKDYELEIEYTLERADCAERQLQQYAKILHDLIGNTDEKEFRMRAKFSTSKSERFFSRKEKLKV